MDFLEFLKSSCHYSDVKFDIRDNKIYKWQTSDYTGFSLYKLNDYYIRVDYCGSSTGYELQHYSEDYKIYKGGSYTGFDLCDSGYGDLRLYAHGSLYGEAAYMKEKEEREKEETHASSPSSSSSVDDIFSDGFWSWKSWGMAWVYILGFTFSAGGILASLISPWLLLIGPGIMLIWAIIIIIAHNMPSRSERLARKKAKRQKREEKRRAKEKRKMDKVIQDYRQRNEGKRNVNFPLIVLLCLLVAILAIAGYVGYYIFFGGGLEAMPLYQWVQSLLR